MKTIIITGFYSTFILFYPSYLITMTVLLPSLQSNSPLIVQKPCGLGLERWADLKMDLVDERW